MKERVNFEQKLIDLEHDFNNEIDCFKVQHKYQEVDSDMFDWHTKVSLIFIEKSGSSTTYHVRDYREAYTILSAINHTLFLLEIKKSEQEIEILEKNNV